MTPRQACERIATCDRVLRDSVTRRVVNIQGLRKIKEHKEISLKILEVKGYKR